MAGITEAKVYEALGITPGGEGANVQEVAEPAAQVSQEAADEGANVQEIAEPAEAATETEPGTQEPEADAANAKPEEPAQDAGQEPGTEKTTMTKDQRGAFAARRRQQAIDNAVAAARAEEQAKFNTQMQTFFQNAGLKDTFTGETITSMDQFNSWFAKFRESQLTQAMQTGKMTPELLQQAISEHPMVKQAIAAVEKLNAANAAAVREREQQQIDAEMAQIMEMDKSITGVADLLTMPGAKEFKEKIDKGYSFLDAFKLVRGPELEQAKEEVARQAAISNARGKEHLSATGSTRGAGAVSVPQSQLKMYRLFNPGMTDAQIQAHYNKQLKQRGGN